MTIEEKQLQRLVGYTMDFHSIVYQEMIKVMKHDIFDRSDYSKVMLMITNNLGKISKEILENNVSHVTITFIEEAAIDLLLLGINIANQEQIMSALCESRLQQILKEVKQAVKKHTIQYNVSYEKQFLIIHEEFGEIAADLSVGEYKDSIIEIYQTIAMLIKLAWLINERLETNT